MKFDYKPAIEEHKVPREKVIKQLVEGVIVETAGDYLVHLNDNKVIPLTEKSFSCEGFSIIYSSKLDKHGRRTKIIRGNSSMFGYAGYYPFKPKLRVRGYVVKECGIEVFDLKENAIE